MRQFVRLHEARYLCHFIVVHESVGQTEDELVAGCINGVIGLGPLLDQVFPVLHLRHVILLKYLKLLLARIDLD